MSARLFCILLASCTVISRGPDAGGAKLPDKATLRWGEPDLCRLARDQKLIEQTTNVLAGVLTVARQSQLNPPWRAVRVVDGSGSNPDDTLELELITDRGDSCDGGSAARDSTSIRGICKVHRWVDGSHPHFHCSEGALAALFGSDGAGSASVFLLLAHELGHALKGTEASYGRAGVDLDLAATSVAKRKALAKVCVASTDERAEEERADSVARQLLASAVATREVGERFLSTRLSAQAAYLQILSAADRYNEWDTQWAETHGAAPDALNDPLFSEELAEWAAKRTICDVLTGSSGHIVLPAFKGSHPPTPLRVRQLALELREVRTGAPPEGLPGAPFDALEKFGLLLDPTVEMDVLYGRAFEKLGRTFCDHVASGWPPTDEDCAAVSRLPATMGSGCEGFERKVEVADAKAVALNVGRDAGELTVDARVVGAVLTTSGIVLALRDPGRIAVITPRDAKAWELQCDPTGLSGDDDGFAAGCGSPPALVEGDGDAARVHRFPDPRALSVPAGSRTAELTSWWVNDDGTYTQVRIEGGRARSLEAWVGEGCRDLHGGLDLHRAANELVGVPPMGSLRSIEVARFSLACDRVIEVLSPELPPELSFDMAQPAVGLSCGFDHGHGRAICADDTGVLWYPTKQARERIATFAKGKIDRAQVCATARSIYVLAGRGEQDELIMIHGGKKRVLRRFEHGVETGLSCASRGALSFDSTPDRSRIQAWLDPVGRSAR